MIDKPSKGLDKTFFRLRNVILLQCRPKGMQKRKKNGNNNHKNPNTMKKLFILSLILLVATMGYSQVRKVSKNDAKNKVATMQVTKGMESSKNVQSKFKNK